MSNPNPTPPKEYQFKPGQSGNPKGKKPGTLSSKTILKRFMGIEQTIQNPITGTDEKLTVAEILYIQQLAKARKGDLAAFKEIMDRWEGKAQQSIDHTTDGQQLPVPILSGVLKNRKEKPSVQRDNSSTEALIPDEED